MQLADRRSTTANDLALPFPPGFLWGTATSAHQIEGRNTGNDWWDWEQTPGHIAGGGTAARAADSFRRWREDLELLAALDQRVYRFSIEWSRIEPEPGRFDRGAIEHYRAILEALARRGIAPLVTLHHFTNPRWLARAGGWERREAIGRFARFVELAVREYGDLVRDWVTINEPTVYVYHGYLLGIWPPGVRDGARAFRALRHLLEAHAAAYRIIHRRSPRHDTRVGLAHAMVVFDPARPGHPLDRAAARLREYLFQGVGITALRDGRLRFPLAPLGRVERLPELAGTQDFFGLNHYTRRLTAFDRTRRGEFYGRDVEPPGLPRNALGWELYPEGLYRLLLELRDWRVPIIVTENGLADPDDALRPRQIVAYLAQAHRALRAGVPLIGYCHWSLLDNFEWAEGLEDRARFGLVHVDYATGERRLKPSAHLYAEICRLGGLTRGMLDEHLLDRPWPDAAYARATGPPAHAAHDR